MTQNRNLPLTVGAYLNFIIAAGHIAALFFLDAAFRYYGIDGIMEKIAGYWATLPQLITICLVVAFIICGLYALSAEGRIKRLPMLWTGIFGIAGAYLLRAIYGIISMACSGIWDFKGLSAFVVAALVGLLYLIGGIKRLDEVRRETV